MGQFFILRSRKFERSSYRKSTVEIASEGEKGAEKARTGYEYPLSDPWGGGVLPIMAYTVRLHLRGVPLLSLKYIKG